jgi:hypothetical protein
LGWAVPAQAASDYLLQLDGIPGESKATGAWPGAGPHFKKGKWIVLESVQLGAEHTVSGVNNASGDVNGDGVSAPSDVKTGQSSGNRDALPLSFRGEERDLPPKQQAKEVCRSGEGFNGKISAPSPIEM